ncbi:Hypothetical protein, putative [Bodo saltans]|uniref:KATNIP domain-containing protein n=1 Tax=Bodo saltans TaxID=75058 RepID=A0A0S4IP09_BODSA|nr:Hypothetical protein, putative [Bodo saltans]|eukprot:CUE99344.1 Hypothetical protein, putative [Bodo saltans]
MSSGRTPTPPPNPQGGGGHTPSSALHTPPPSSLSPIGNNSGSTAKPTSAGKSRQIAGGLPPPSKESHVTPQRTLPPGAPRPTLPTSAAHPQHYGGSPDSMQGGRFSMGGGAGGSGIGDAQIENNRYASFVPSGLEEELHPLSLVATPLHLYRPTQQQQQQQLSNYRPDFESSPQQQLQQVNAALSGSTNRYRDAVSPSNQAASASAAPHVASLRQSVVCAALGSQQNRGRLSAIAPSVLSLALSPSQQKQQQQQQYSVPPELSPNGTASSSSTVRGATMTSQSTTNNNAGVGEGTINGSSTSPNSSSPKSHNNLPSPNGGGGGVGMEAFLSPVMPQGRYLMLNLLTTWGDSGEVGLNGVEVYDQRGLRIVPTRRSSTNNNNHATDVVPPIAFTVAADTLGDNASSRGTSPLSISSTSASSPIQHGSSGTTSEGILNPLTEILRQRYNVANLVNGIVHTTDEHRMYATPFRNGKHHLVCIGFPVSVSISAIRLFNYRGGGRSKTNKGARLIEMTVDDQLIFRGEIAESNGGNVGNVPAASPEFEDCETILFTEDKTILERLFVEMSHNHSPHYPQHAAEDSAATGALLRNSTTTDGYGARGSRHRGGGGVADVVRTSIAFAPSAPLLSQQFSEMFSPMVYGGKTGAGDMGPPSVASLKTQVGVSSPCAFPSAAPKRVTSICIQVVSTWGDANFVGLSGIRLRDPSGNPIFNVSQVLINRPSGKKDDAGDAEFAALLDNDPNTACVWAYESGIQLVIVFQQPVDLGFIEIANYSLGRKTYCGVKCARVFTSTMPIVSIATGGGGGSSHHASSSVANQHLAFLYASLWDQEAGAQLSSTGGLCELTPGDEGITLRKSPATMATLRFQSFDVSLASSHGGGGGGGAHSLRLSMNTRAAVAIRRARQSLLDPPQWLLDHQAYLPSILPVAYVFKVTIALYGKSSARTFKHLLTAWASRPHDALTFMNDSGQFVNPQEDELWCEGQVTVLDSKGGDEGDNNGDDDLEDDGIAKVAVTLIFVSDSLFAIAALFLRAPLILFDDSAINNANHSNTPPAPGDAGTSWVQSVRVFADDTLVYRGRDAAVSLDGRNGGDAVHVVNVDNDDEAVDERSSPVRALGFDDDVAAPAKNNSNSTVPSVLFFTLDDRVLQAYRPAAM